MAALSTAPNVVVVVLDCVRSDDLGGAGPTSPQLPTLARLRSESVSFPKCASVSHWTLPSHASIFSGVYPWTHGLYQGGRSVLSGEVPLMARWLARAGYRTGAFNSNGLLNPSFGWLDGFEYAGWGSSAYLRSSGSTRPPHELGSPTRAPRWRESVPELLRRATYWGVVGLERFPLLLDRVARAESRWRGGGGYSRPVLSPWIDHTLPRWLATVPAQEPAFAFVNLMDAHEPYLMDREDGFTRKDLSDASRVRQDHHGWIEGRWHPSARESELLHRLYRGSLRLLDARVERIVESLKAAGRWENTMFVLTSDHGQAFGRDGVMYHMLGISDELLRVPLWVRYPGGAGGGTTGQGWASLIDVPATVAEVTQAPAPSFADAVSLSRLVRQDRSAPAYAIADGATFGDASEHVAASRLDRYDFRAVAGYLGRWKGVLSLPTRQVRFFDVEHDPLEQHPVERPDGAEASGLLDGLEQVASRFAASPGLGESSADRRLRAWGYAD